MTMDLPRYCIVGKRPVKLVETADGGMDCLAYDWDTGAFQRNMDYLTRATLPDGEVDVVTADEFDEAVATLRAERSRGDG
ncbi:MAG: hypothetical protein RIF41_03110 [Polyangiaceae bacterium]